MQAGGKSSYGVWAQLMGERTPRPFFRSSWPLVAVLSVTAVRLRRLGVDRKHSADAAEVSGGIGRFLSEHRPGWRHGHRHHNDDTRMPLGCIDGGELGLRVVSGFRTGVKHG